jgi:hypothetical protein
METYKQYIEVSKKIEALEAEKDVLREKISAELPEEGYKDETLTAFWKTSKKWKYSPKVDGLNAELKATKKAEEEDGTATAEESKILTITVK